MARIRTVKPEFFRHEQLQDLEISRPDLRPMLVFAGLWGQCDKNGVFEWKPRLLKLDILPFLGNDMGASLTLLREAGLIIMMLHGEKTYGVVPSFRTHQRLGGKEAQDASKYPQPADMVEVKYEGSTGEAQGKHRGSQEGKGKEGKEEGKEAAVCASADARGSGGPVEIAEPKGAGEEKLEEPKPEGPKPELVPRQVHMLLSEILDLKRTCLQTLQENSGQAVVLQDICNLYAPEAIREAFAAAAVSNVKNLNWVLARLRGKGRDSPRGGAVNDAETVAEQNRQAVRDFCGEAA